LSPAERKFRVVGCGAAYRIAMIAEGFKDRVE
jgi:hypothetical protein